VGIGLETGNEYGFDIGVCNDIEILIVYCDHEL
jgi:hypothetical protein